LYGILCDIIKICRLVNSSHRQKRFPCNEIDRYVHLIRFGSSIGQFITACTKTRHRTRRENFKSSLHPRSNFTKINFNIILLTLPLPFFLSNFSIKIWYMHPISQSLLHDQLIVNFLICLSYVLKSPQTVLFGISKFKLSVTDPFLLPLVFGVLPSASASAARLCRQHITRPRYVKGVNSISKILYKYETIK
jgi:hypothetical protein